VLLENHNYKNVGLQLRRGLTKNKVLAPADAGKRSCRQESEHEGRVAEQVLLYRMNMSNGHDKNDDDDDNVAVGEGLHSQWQ